MPGLQDLIGKLYVHKRLARAFWMNEVFIAETYYWLVQDLRPNTTAYDLGSGLGESAIYLAMQPNITSVKSYEANRSNYEAAKSNIGKSPRKGRIELVLEKVSALRDIAPNSIIKMDVEGDELAILEKTNLDNVYRMTIEYHSTLEGCIGLLTAKGFRTEIKEDHLDNKIRLGYINAWKT